jgi:hypothetical protein
MQFTRHGVILIGVAIAGLATAAITLATTLSASAGAMAAHPGSR